MKVDAGNQIFHNIAKSKFVRSIFFRMLSIFMIVIVVVIAIVFFSFTSEINKNIISERQKQLSIIENSISSRMAEVSSIAYNIGDDKLFYFEPVAEYDYSRYEMSKVLDRYLVGNDFVEYLAYYRLSEPDIIYVSNGEVSFKDFWKVYLGLDDAAVDKYLDKMKNLTEVQSTSHFSEDENKAFLTYTCPLPRFSKNPKAFVLMIVPFTEIKPILETQLSNYYGEIAVFDASGNEMCRVSKLDKNMPINLYDRQSNECFTYGGQRFITQRVVSEKNGWVYVSIIRLNDIISQTANKQLVFIILLLALMVIAVFAMIMHVIKQYKPISNLAMSFADKSEGNDFLIDEETLLSDTFATLKGDSEQKQRFETAYNEANAANKAKSAFLSNMSHDIRTPMNAIVGMTEIAIKNVDNPKYVKACLEKVRIASQYLLDIINNVLDMSRIESGKFVLSEDIIELPKLIHGIITILNQSLIVKSQTLIVEVGDIRDESVIGDNVHLAQVFMNILSNSSKFTPNGGALSITMSQTDSAEDGYGDYVFAFSDTGIGMSSEFTNKVFETFTRDEKSDISKIEGTGLGMAIAKNFVELMGGTIKCESELGKGTTFTIKMRMKLAEKEISDINYERYKSMSVLVVGSDEAVCLSEIRMFEEFGVKVDYASDNAKAMEKAAQNPIAYDFILINQSGDDISGIDAVTQISSVVGEANTTYVFAAQDILSVEKSYAFDSGIAVFVQIPLFRSTVLDILNRTIKTKDAIFTDFVELNGLNVLLVEDNDINRTVAHSQISAMKANIFDAANGKEAVEAFKEHEPGFFDIILMDLQMPIMNGYEATAAIRSIQREDAQTVLIYAMTANTFDEDVRQVKEAGMNGHLGKPYTFEELYKIIKKAAECTNKRNLL